MLLPFFSIDYYLLSMSEVIQEMFKESSVNNSLKSVPRLVLSPYTYKGIGTG